MNQKKTTWTILQNRPLQHLLFWGVAYVILLHFFAYEEELYLVDYLYSSLFLLSIIGGVYTNLFFLIPRLFQKGRYFLYLGSLILCILATAQLNEWTFDFIAGYFFPDFYFISYYRFFEILQFAIVFIGISSLIKLSKSWFQLRETEQRLLASQKSSLQSELQALKAQINPHFLFNSLNSIYAMTIEENKNSSTAILQLSQVMRYLLYEADAELVPLKKEIQLIQHYLALQKSRTEDQLDIQLEIQGELSTQSIKPLLLIPLVENAFKHGSSEAGKLPFVHLSIRIREQQIQLNATNSIDPHSQNIAMPYSGIGLQNLRRQLELLYPEQHRLTISKENHQYTAILEIPLV